MKPKRNGTSMDFKLWALTSDVDGRLLSAPLPLEKAKDAYHEYLAEHPDQEADLLLSNIDTWDQLCYNKQLQTWDEL